MSRRGDPSSGLRIDHVPTSSAVGAILLIAQQFGSRGLTFIVNQILIRYLSPELLGISTQLEVYSITILFFSRESLRLAIQRQVDTVDSTIEAVSVDKVPQGYVDGRTSAGRTQEIVNLAYVSICMGVFFTLAITWLYLRSLSARDPATLDAPYFKLAVVQFGVASLLELLAEPCYVVVQQKSRFSIRATAESVATVFRCLTACSTAIWSYRVGIDTGVLPFALGQGAYAISLLAVYYWKVVKISSHGGFALSLKPIFSIETRKYMFDYISRSIFTLSRSFFFQSLFKHALTQGDTIIISALAPSRVQGVYALANNYGGLVARLILQPLEESSRNHFGKLLSFTSRAPTKEVVKKAGTSLFQMIRSYLIISVIIFSTGPIIAPLLLQLVAGSKWTESGAGEVLGTYCYYIPLLAINGLTEAFISSVATESEVYRQTGWMAAFSFGFAGAAFLLLRVGQFGAHGLVLANAINMLLRILWGSAFIKSYLARYANGFTIDTLMPRPITLAAGAGAYATLLKVQQTFNGGLLDFCKSSVIAVGLLCIISMIERRHLLGCYRELQSPSKAIS